MSAIKSFLCMCVAPRNGGSSISELSLDVCIKLLAKYKGRLKPQIAETSTDDLCSNIVDKEKGKIMKSLVRMAPRWHC